MMEFLTSIFAVFAVGTLWFWILVGVFVGFMIYCVESDFKFLSTLLMLGLILAMNFVFGFNMLAYTVDHPWSALGIVFGYFMTGAVWAMIKWAMTIQSLFDEAEPYVAGFRDGSVPRYVDLSTSLLRFTSTAPSSRNGYIRELQPDDDQHQIMLNTIAGALGSKLYDYNTSLSVFPPSPLRNKSKFVYWIGFWPFSFLWFALNKPIRYISTFIYNRMVNTMVRINNGLVSLNMRSFKPTVFDKLDGGPTTP